MTAGVGKARPPRSFPTGLAKCLRPGAQTQTVAKPRTWEKAAFLASRLLNHSRFPDGRAHGFAAPLRVALPPPVASAHRAHASLRACRGLGLSPKPYAGAFFVSVASVRRREGKRVPCGHLPPEVAKRPGAHRREASALWAARRSAKRPAGAPEGSVSPVGCCRQRRQSDPKA